MHEDVRKLINIAMENGELTAKQREIILRRAKAVGQDIDEVEMVLESFSRTTSNAVSSNKVARKCPRCGAYVSSLESRCPECGTILDSEDASNSVIRDSIAALEHRLNEISVKRTTFNTSSIALLRKDIIRSFSVPLTKTAQILAFNYAKGCYEAANTKGFLDPGPDIYDEAGIWLGKAKEFYNNVAAMSNLDDETKIWLKVNEPILRKKTTSTYMKTLTLLGIMMAVCIALIFLADLLGIG